MKGKRKGLSHEKAVKYGKKGGNPVLLALKQGKTVTINGKRYVPKGK